MPGPKSHKATNYPYVKHASDEFTYDDLGGGTEEWIAAAQLKLGEMVIMTAVDTVNKSLVTPERLIGVVVGGAQTGGYVVTDKTVYGTMIAANAGERVIVLVRGITWVITDSALTFLTNIIPDTVTAGRVKTAGAARGNGIMLETASGVAGIAKAKLF